MSHLNRRLFLKSLAMAPVMLYCGEAKAGPAIRFLQRGLSGVSGLSCVTEYFANDAAYAERYAVGNDANSIFIGQASFVPAADYSLCKIVVYLYRQAGSITGFSYEFRIYSMSVNNLGALVAATAISDTVSGDNDWSFTPVTFNFSTPVALVTTGSYGLVLYRSDGMSSTNRASMSFSSAGGLEGVYRRWDADGITTGTSTNDLICTGYR